MTGARIPWLLLSLALLVFALSSRRATPRQAAGEPGPQQLQTLLEQRRDTLKQLVAIAKENQRIGRSTQSAVVRAANSLLEAELELADTPGRRILVRQQMVENLNKLEAIATARHQSATGGIEDVLEARAGRLHAEIQLLREQIR